MKKDIEQINIEFNTAARKYFFNVCDLLDKASVAFAQRQQETEYMQMHAMYWELLKINLHTEALTIMEKYKNVYDVYLLQKAITVNIDRYLNEFKFKYRLP